MELWIRSQDRKCLIPINDTLSISSNCIFYKGNILAQYKTEQRAINILNEIQNILNPVLVYKQPKMEDFNIQELANEYIVKCNQEVEMNLKQAGQFVYQMPEK